VKLEPEYQQAAILLVTPGACRARTSVVLAAQV
jgi:hypothetical protein